ncbi:MAG: cbb3-type cytochrome c oxidase N-terminal domain-containing protein [Flavobacteriales bacterium]
MKRIPLYILIPIVLGLIIGAFYFVSDNKEEFDLANVYLIGTLVIATLLLFVIDALDRLIENYKISILPEEEKINALKSRNKSFFQSLYESAFQKQSEQEEKDLVIDHGFDGITELDNNLPKWWLGILYVTMVYAAIYSVFVLFTDFANPPVEYEVAVAKFEKNYVPPTYDQFIAETTLDEGKIPAGKALFESNCVSCHMKGGAGAAGPNLTDDFWKSQFTDDLYSNIASVVWKGVEGTAMVPWGEDQKLSPEEIEQVSAYVQSLRGVKPPTKPKSPEGTLASWAEIK